jgi:hypothetical protein
MERPGKSTRALTRRPLPRLWRLQQGVSAPTEHWAHVRSLTTLWEGFVGYRCSENELEIQDWRP